MRLTDLVLLAVQLVGITIGAPDGQPIARQPVTKQPTTEKTVVDHQMGLTTGRPIVAPEKSVDRTISFLTAHPTISTPKDSSVYTTSTGLTSIWRPQPKITIQTINTNQDYGYLQPFDYEPYEVTTITGTGYSITRITEYVTITELSRIRVTDCPTFNGPLVTASFEPTSFEPTASFEPPPITDGLIAAPLELEHFKSEFFSSKKCSTKCHAVTADSGGKCVFVRQLCARN